LAVFLSTGVSFALVLLFTRTKPFIKILAIITLCLIGWALIFSLSRSAWGSFVVAICFVLLLALRRKRIGKMAAVVIACAAALILLGVALFGSDLILARLTSNDQGSSNSRITLAEAAWAMIRDNPVVGVGLNNYALVSPRYDQADAASWNNYSPIVHNIYLLIAAETGIIGLFAFLVFLINLLIQTWRIIDQAPNDTIWVASVGIWGALIAIMINGMADYILLGSGLVFAQFWLFAGITAALINRINHEKVKSRRTEGTLSTLA
jgi:O-antigen ligase